MALSKKGKARLIIGTFASLAAAWSAVTAIIPIIGPLLADTAGLTLLTIGMAYSLAVLYDKSLDSASLAAFASVAIGFIAGQLALKMGASLIPIFSSYFNASVTFVLHGAIGWGLCEIFEKGKVPGDFSKEELKQIFRSNKDKAKEEKERYEKAMNALPSDGTRKVKSLRRKLCDRNLSNEERDAIVEQIADVFEMHGVENVFED